jgi:hypothetical protein
VADANVSANPTSEPFEYKPYSGFAIAAILVTALFVVFTVGVLAMSFISKR